MPDKRRGNFTKSEDDGIATLPAQVFAGQKLGRVARNDKEIESAETAVAANVSLEKVKEKCLNDEKIKKTLEGKSIKNIIFVPNKLINIVAQ